MQPGALLPDMETNGDRSEFAAARLVPPFGTVLKWFVHILQLERIGTYAPDPADIARQHKIQQALRTLAQRRIDSLPHGEIMQEETKAAVCEALESALRATPALPFASDDLTKAILNIWKGYEHVSGRITAFSAHRDSVLRAMLRHATAELAVRAAAMACLCDDPSSAEDRPLWSTHKQLQKHLKTLNTFGSRERAVQALSTSKGVMDRCLDYLEIPDAGVIRRWDDHLSRATPPGPRFGAHHLWRLFVGRRVWEQIEKTVPKDMRGELLRAYSRIKRKLMTNIRMRTTTEENRTRMLKLLLVLGRISDPGLVTRIVQGEQDPLWRRHIEALCVNAKSPTLNIIDVCREYASGASVFAAMQQKNSRLAGAASKQTALKTSATSKKPKSFSKNF